MYLINMRWAVRVTNLMCLVEFIFSATRPMDPV